MALRGTSSTISSCSGTFCLARPSSRQCSAISTSVSDVDAVGQRDDRAARAHRCAGRGGRSPRRRRSTGAAWRISSTSLAEMFSALRMMMSFSRPVMRDVARCRRRCRGRRCGSSPARRARRRRAPGWRSRRKSCGPRSRSSPSSPGPQSRAVGRARPAAPRRARAGPRSSRSARGVSSDAGAGRGGELGEAPAAHDADAAELRTDQVVDARGLGCTATDARAQAGEERFVAVRALRGEVGLEHRQRGAEQRRTLLGHERAASVRRRTPRPAAAGSPTCSAAPSMAAPPMWVTGKQTG